MYAILNTIVLKMVLTIEPTALVNQTETKVLKVGSRHTIYLEKAFVEDSSFPFKPNEPLKAKIEGKKVVLEKA